MSIVAERRWEVEARQRRKIYLNRIRDLTESYAERNRERIESLSKQGLDVYIAGEYESCLRSLDRVSRLLNSDPESARDENIRLSAVLRDLSGKARRNRRNSQAKEQEAAALALEAERDALREQLVAERDARQAKTVLEKTARKELLAMIRESRMSLEGPTARDLSQPHFIALRNEIEGMVVDLNEIDEVRASLRMRLQSIAVSAQMEARELEDAESQEVERLEVEQAISDAIKVYGQLKDSIAQQAVRKLHTTFISGRTSICELDHELEAIGAAADERAMQESGRRHVVGGLLRELRQAGFIVSEPKLRDGEVTTVLIKAKRPSGAQAVFTVALDGMSYKFDHYQGQVCLEDVEKVLPRLQKIYGIDLGEEKVSWRNPDRIGSSEKQLPGGIAERKK
jgi:hypothetical protein